LYPQPGRAWKLTPWALVAIRSCGYRGAPPRGVDVKPPPGIPEIRDFRPFLGIFPKMGFLATFRPGSYRAKMPKNVEKWRFLAFLTIFSENAGKTRFFGVLGLKRPFLALLGLLAQGFYINPSGALPRGRGSPPRGLGGLGTRVPGDRGGPETSGIPDPGIGVWKPLPPGRGGPGRPRDQSREAPRVGFYINPSRRGPAVPGRGPGVPKVAPVPRGGSGRPPRRSWDCPSPGGTPAGNRGRGSPHRGRGEDPLLLPEEGRPV